MVDQCPRVSISPGVGHQNLALPVDLEVVFGGV